MNLSATVSGHGTEMMHCLLHHLNPSESGYHTFWRLNTNGPKETFWVACGNRFFHFRAGGSATDYLSALALPGKDIVHQRVYHTIIEWYCFTLKWLAGATNPSSMGFAKIVSLFYDDRKEVKHASAPSSTIEKATFHLLTDHVYRYALVHAGTRAVFKAPHKAPQRVQRPVPERNGRANPNECFLCTKQDHSHGAGCAHRFQETAAPKAGRGTNTAPATSYTPAKHFASAGRRRKKASRATPTRPVTVVTGDKGWARASFDGMDSSFSHGTGPLPPTGHHDKAAPHASAGDRRKMHPASKRSNHCKRSASKYLCNWCRLHRPGKHTSHRELECRIKCRYQRHRCELCNTVGHPKGLCPFR